MTLKEPPAEEAPADGGDPREFLYRLWFPVIFLAVGMKAARLYLTLGLRPVEIVDGLRPELFAYGGLVGLAWALYTLSAGTAGRLAVAAGSVLLAVPLALIETCAHFFFGHTGNHLDGPMLRYAVVESAALWRAMGDALPLAPFVVLAIPLGWMVTAAATRPWREPPSTPTEEGYARVLLVAGPLLLLLALPAPLILDAKALGRWTPVELVHSSWRQPVLPDVAPSPAKEWLDAELVDVATSEQRRNVAIIWLESTSWRATSLGGPHPTTPILAKLSEESLVATQAWTVVPHSTKAAVSIYCGVHPRLSTWVTESEDLPARCLPHLLREQGYATLMLRSGTREFEGWSGLIGNIGFEDFLALEDLDVEGFEPVNYFGYEDDILLAPARTWLEARGDQPFLISYMTGTAHHDYLVPSDFETVELLADEEQNAYLNAVRYVDRFLGKVLDLHRELGLYENTVFVVVGDHGEAFREHGLHWHDGVPYEEVAHVPLLIHVPGGPESGTSVDWPSSQLDILPTVVDQLGYELRAPGREGRSLLGSAPDRTLKLYCWYERRCGAVRDGDLKLVYHFEARPPELYDLGSDPLERDDLAADRSDEVRHLTRELLTWVARGQVRYVPNKGGSR